MPEEAFGKVLDRRSAGESVTTTATDHGTKTEFLKNPAQGKLPSFPGDFELRRLVLKSPHKDEGEGEVDIRAAWSDLNIYEDLFGSYLTGNIQIVDGVGLRENLPIIGEETLHLEVKTKGIERQRNQNLTPGPFEGSGNEGIMKLKFRIIKISNITQIQDGMQSYKLSFVSEEAIINLKQKVRKSALDPVDLQPSTIDKLAKRIYKESFETNRTGIPKKIFIEPTKNPTELIVPNQSPFSALNFLCTRAVSQGPHASGSSYVFYETTRGFFFISMETLMTGGGMGYSFIDPERPEEGAMWTTPTDPVKETYVVQPKRLGNKSNDLQNVAIEMTAVDSYSFSSNFDVIQNLQRGMYSNRLLTHDLVRMKYDTLDFNLLPPATTQRSVDPTTGAIVDQEFSQQSAEAKKFNDDFAHLGKGALATEKQDALGSPESAITFYPTNFGHDVRFPDDLGAKTVHGHPKGKLLITPTRVEQWMQSRMVQMQQASNIKLNIRAPGLSTRSVGDLIEFKLPTQYIEDRTGVTQAQHHTYLSGYYLITKLRHHFNKEKYSIEFEAIKDTLAKSVGGNRQPAEGNLPADNVVNAPDTNDPTQVGPS